ncbi:MAG: response regulator [Nitrospinae bacterium]|nr:response regulator [Nitrospinota bacterium]
MVKILIVEDESIIAKDLKNRLERLGYEIPAAVQSGEEAVKKAKELHPDLVLMDIMLRGMSGIAAADQIRISCNIPVLYVTAFSDENILKLAKMTEPYGYILKPFDERELHIAIEMALYRHKMETKLRESEQWLTAILKSIGDGVIVTDKEGYVKFMNPTAERLTDWSMEKASGKELKEVFHIANKKTRENIECYAAKAIRHNAVLNLPENTVLISKGGVETDIEAHFEISIDDSTAPVKDSKGEIIGAVIVFRDISGQK